MSLGIALTLTKEGNTFTKTLSIGQMALSYGCTARQQPMGVLPGVHCYAETLVKDNGNVN